MGKRPRMSDEEYELWQKIKDNDFIINQVEELEKECEEAGIDVENVKQYWYKTERFSLFVDNPDTPVNNVLDKFEELSEKYAEGEKREIKQRSVDEHRAIKVTTTDDHVGLEPNPDNNALFQYEYNADVYKESMNKVYNSVMKEYNTYGTFDFLLLDNLGDQEDGWQGETVRGGHDLPQNMTADEVFDVVVDTKVNQIINFAEEGVANQIILRKCVNDNHCFTQDTEVLTDNGWKKYHNILKNDKIASVDVDTQNIVYDEPIDYIYNEPKENIKIHSYQNKNIDLNVTSEHRILHRRNRYNPKNSVYEYVKSNDVVKGGQINFLVSANNQNKDYDISDDFIKFCAWINTDGSIRKRNEINKEYVIYQCEKQIDLVTDLLDEIGCGYRKTLKKNSNIKEICGKKLLKKPQKMYEVVLNENHTTKKFLEKARKYIKEKQEIPEWVYKLSKRQFDVYLETFIDGDGTWHNGNETKSSAIIYGKKDILDQLQHLCFQNGHKTNLSVAREKHYRLNVLFNKREISFKPKKQFSEKSYSGYTWCLTMPKSNMVVRRNGKVTVQGNSGDFGHIVNKAVQKIINRIYDEEYVKVEHLTRFMEHRFYGEHCFILTHGKDKEHMRSGLPLKLNNKTKNYINEYIDFYDIREPYIHVEKGDLHQLGYDKTKKFDYRNFMSFAPPSSWQQTNFGDGYAGYSIQVIPKFSNEISHTNYYLDYEKKT